MKIQFRKFVLVPLLLLAGASAAASLATVYFTDAGFAATKKPPATKAAAPKLQIAFPPISSQLPSDIPGGANNANITSAAIFAWQEFIALNWPAAPTGVSGSGTRGAPDNSQKFGADSSGPNQANQPVVWETYRGKVETFPGVGDPPGYSNGASQDYGFDVAPQYIYGTRTTTPPTPPGGPEPQGALQNNPGGPVLLVPACQSPAQPIATTPSYINLDEITQIGLDSMFANVLPYTVSNPTALNANDEPQLIRFLAKGNRAFYDYVAASQFWYQGQAFATAESNFHTAALANSYPAPTPNIELPAGTVLVKAAWRPLAPGEIASNFHTKTVRFYDENGTTGFPCYREQTWALIALHIIQKTPTAPDFIFATFEYTSNILNANGTPVEDQNGKEIAAPIGDGMDPRLNYFDVNSEYYSPAYPKGIIVPPQPPVPNPPPPSPPPGASLPLVQVTGPYCNVAANVMPPAKNARLYFQDINANTNDPIPPPNTGVCVNKRYFAIPSQIQQVNAAAHAALQSYGAPALWQNYKLVNVQWQPFNTSEIDTTGTNTNRLASIYSLANAVVETDNTLQEFFGGLFAPGAAFFKSAFEANPSSGIPTPPYPAYNIYGPPAGGNPNQFTRTVMGGCMGCHGRAQRAGTDFSFTLSGGPVAGPEFGVLTAPTGALAANAKPNFAAGFDLERLKKLHRALAGY